MSFDTSMVPTEKLLMSIIEITKKMALSENLSRIS